MNVEIMTELTEVDFGASGAKEIIQNVRTILSVMIGTVALDRRFGSVGNLVDEPLPVAKAKMVAGVIGAIKKYEPRCEVIDVTFEGDAIEGILRPKVRLKIIE